MKAVIMAGGIGNRLRPLTCTLPKPMAHLCGTPVLEYILDLLSAHNCDEAVITLKYLPDCVMDNFPENDYNGIKLTFSIEEKALGTAGSVNLAAKKFDEPFLVISGDALCNYNLTEIMRYHSQKGADATIVCTQVDDPREYGLVNADAEGKIQGFTEKPGWEQVSTNLANTGIYVLNPSVLRHIEDNKECDFANDVFPAMLTDHEKLYSYNANGYWCDIGDFEAYKTCQFDLLRGIDGIPLPNHQDAISFRGKAPSGHYTLVPPVYIGENVNIGKGCVVGPNAVLDDSVILGENTRVNNSVLLQGAYIGADVRINSAIICEDAVIKRNADVFEGAVIGSQSILGENASVGNNVYIWPEKNIPQNARVNDNIREGSLSSDSLDNDAVRGESFAELSSERAARLGAAVGSTKDGRRVGIGSDGSPASKTIAMAVTSGLLSTGSSVWDFGECFQSQLNFFTSYCELKLGIYVSTIDNFTSIQIIGENALVLGRKTERDISSRYKRRDFIKCPSTSCHDITDMSSLFLMYKRELLSLAKESLASVSASVRCENKRIYRYMTELLATLGCKSEGELTFIFDEQGQTLQAFDENGDYVSGETLLSICCNEEFQQGRDVFIPYDAPSVIDSIAQTHGRKVLRHMDSSANEISEDAKRLIFANIWARDALFMTVKLLGNMARSKKTLAELVAELPKFHVQKKVLEIDISPSHLLAVFQTLTDQSPDRRQGIVITSDAGEIRLTPAKNGKELRIISEAYSEETALELCGDIEEKIKSECDKLSAE